MHHLWERILGGESDPDEPSDGRNVGDQNLMYLFRLTSEVSHKPHRVLCSRFREPHISLTCTICGYGSRAGKAIQMRHLGRLETTLPGRGEWARQSP